MSDYTCGNSGACSLCANGCSLKTDKLNEYDWLADLPDNATATDIVEVQFKPPRKSFFLNTNHLDLKKGDIVAVEANPGHDIGTVTMTGRLVALQIKKARLKPDFEFKRIYRHARKVDLDKWREARAQEHETMIESRQIAKDLGLKMKIGDVEYQGDGNKAIFYYIADERVDFRQLIKVLAERFHVRIEMKQIGARQEAGRIGGIGPCGRELCCCTWMTSFSSVATSAARLQDLSLNPQKLAGQCAKLKCCLNYEVDQYVEALKSLPSRQISLHTIDAEYFFVKADILHHTVTYSTDKHVLANERTISAKRAFQIIEMNRNGEKPEALTEDGKPKQHISLDLLEQENISRFDSQRRKKKKNKPKPQGNRGENGGQNAGAKPQNNAGGKPQNGGNRQQNGGGRPQNAASNKQYAANNKPQQRPRNNNQVRKPNQHRPSNNRPNTSNE